MHIHLLPVYSCSASELPEGVTLPEGWKGLSWHQTETVKALRDPNIDVVINTAMTGDGKSLTIVLETFFSESYYCVLAMYPTNELARDQESQMKEYIATFKPTGEPRVSRLSGPELEVYAENEGLPKYAALNTQSQQHEILLSNPDIFHYLHQGAYLRKGDSPDLLWGRIDKDFNLFVFDEFHVFSAPQIVGVINTLLLIRNTNRNKKFLFLSATPDQQLINLLEKAGFRVKVINPHDKGKYQFPENIVTQQELEEQHWRQVARKIDLHFVSLQLQAKALEEWLRAEGAMIRDQFVQFPGTKGAIILNSIAAVKRLLPYFQELLAPLGLTVSENTGLSSKSVKEKSLEADLVLGTSTIDIGVDFKINLLLFESADAGSFIQRLGRLGRHDGYTRAEVWIPFTQFTAYALVPNFFAERLFQGPEAPLMAEGIYDRPFFHEQVRAKYRRVNEFERYYHCWGAVQSLHLYQQLKNRTVRETYSGSQVAFQEAAEAVFKTKLTAVFMRRKEWQEQWKEISGGKAGNPIAEDAISFRGTSPLQCGIYDLTETSSEERFKSYELPGILSNLETEPITEAEFMRLLKVSEEKTGQPIAKGRFKNSLLFVKLKRYRKERLDWKFLYSGDIVSTAQRWKVQILSGLRVWQPGNPWINTLNDRLQRHYFVCFLVLRPVAEVRAQLQLPMHFQLYPLANEPYGSTPYSIAFGQAALLLDTLSYRLKQEGGASWIC
ncbi:type I-D CRISPR-associated helicase Cas3' [Anthocerotibacter panamensis]|uniref:type I-D CRISPR-associated helicase Cas3' n=1 Tax=Anthocerotibacter panamensis TaxID=2857077 RepID=UPI001C404341|nr:type I-D CRISPR-associated helicase Cas3' [Anthocerotibacter panamensis]